MLSEITPALWGTSWAVRDGAGACLPIRATDAGGWRLAAISGGHPLTLAREWDSESLLPLGAWAADGYRPLL